MASRVQPKILEAAIRLFGAFGFNGVTTRHLAEEADVVEGSIYLCFGSKENLYREAVDAVIKRQSASLGQFLVGLHGGTAGGGERKWQLTQAIQAWYNALSPAGARLMQQVLMADKKRYPEVCNSLDSIINVIAKILQEERDSGRQRNRQAVARILIYALLQARAVCGESDSELASRDMIKEWLLSVAAAVD